MPSAMALLLPPVIRSHRHHYHHQLHLSSRNEDTLERFHMDLRKVLTLTQPPSAYFRDSMARHEKPIILPFDVDGAEKAYKMLHHMIRIGCCSEESFRIVMRAFLRRGRVRWKLLSDTASTSTTTTTITTTTNNNSNDVYTCAADQLEALLQQLQDTQNTPISQETFHLLLQAYATCATPRGERNYAMRAQHVLEQMNQQQATIDTTTLLYLIQAWSWQQANKENGDCAQKAQDFLEQVEQITNDTAILIPSYEYVLEAWSKSKNAPEKAQLVFDKRLRLGPVPMSCFTNVILAWSKAPAGAKRANELLHEMLTLFQQGTYFPLGQEPELIAFNSVITAWGRAQHPDTAEQILHLLEQTRLACTTLVPNVLTYNAVLHAYYQSSQSHVALERALAIVQYMEDHADKEPQIEPDNYTYNTLMKAWVNSGHVDSVEHAERILMKMERLAATTYGQDTSNPITSRNFNIVINAYAKSNHRLAAQKALALLERMKKSSKIQPDVVSYTSVIECFSKSTEPNASQVAVDLLHELQHKYSQRRDVNLMPNARTFTMVILALSKCPLKGNVQTARELLTQLKEEYAKTKNESLEPNAYSYNYVLNCAANTVGTKEDKIQAFQAAAKTYQELRASIPADSFTYAFWLKACNNLLPPSTELYEKFVTLAFEECQKDGLVNQEVLTRLQQGHLSKEKICAILKVKMGSSSSIRVDDVPPAWSRNVKGSAAKAVPKRKSF